MSLFCINPSNCVKDKIYLRFLSFHVTEMAPEAEVPYLGEDKNLPILPVKVMVTDYLTGQWATVSTAMVLI